MCSLSTQTDWVHGVARTKTFHLGDYSFPAKYRVQKLVNSLNIKRKVPGGLTIYGGSQWFTITPQAADYVVQYLKKHKKLAKYFRLTFAADELVFQTILNASPFKNQLVNDNLRYIQMSPQTFRPTVMDISKKDDLLNSGMFFTRKMEPEQSAAIMDVLDVATMQ